MIPKYVSDLIQIRQYEYSKTRSSKTVDRNLAVPFMKQKTSGDRSYAVSAPTLWSMLPSLLKNSDDYEYFKKQLKTHFYKSAFESAS